MTTAPVAKPRTYRAVPLPPPANMAHLEDRAVHKMLKAPIQGVHE